MMPTSENAPSARIISTSTDPADAAEFREMFLRERRDAMRVARHMVATCRAGDSEAFLETVDAMAGVVDGWRYAMLGIGRLPSVPEAVRAAFTKVWIEHKGLSGKAGDRRATAKTLRLMMPPTYSGPDMTLYRGASACERRNAAYGFSWTTDREMAKTFGELRRRWPGGGVLMQTIAPPDAVLLQREQEGYYDEEEVVLDPYKIGSVHLIERFR